MLVVARESWMQRGKCRGMDQNVFFPNVGGDAGDARDICVGCPVQNECLNYAIENRIEIGIWGGTSRTERRRIIRERKVS